MKLLLDENISYRVIKVISTSFPGSIHVLSLKGHLNSDRDIFFYARTHGFLIVTFDEDFYELQLLKGAPPKIVWLRFGIPTIRKLLINYWEQRIK